MTLSLIAVTTTLLLLLLQPSSASGTETGAPAKKKLKRVPNHFPGDTFTVTRKTWSERLHNDYERIVFVKVYSEGCGHCTAMADEWRALAKKYENVPEVLIASLNAGTEKTMAKHYNVKSYPTMLMFWGATREQRAIPIQYKSGTRTVKAFSKFVDKHLKKHREQVAAAEKEGGEEEKTDSASPEEL